MACPKCGCKTTYQYDDEDDPKDDRLQRCAACGDVFDLEDEEPEECECCGGTGKIRETEFVDGDQTACMTCNGRGK